MLEENFRIQGIEDDNNKIAEGAGGGMNGPLQYCR
jgi:hypothetical protein